MAVKYYCIDCGQNLELEELERKICPARVVEFICPACGNTKFEITE